MQTQEGVSELGADDKGVGERRIVCPDFGDVLPGSCVGSLIVWLIDLGDVTMYWECYTP